MYFATLPAYVAPCGNLEAVGLVAATTPPVSVSQTLPLTAASSFRVEVSFSRLTSE